MLVLHAYMLLHDVRVALVAQWVKRWPTDLAVRV